MVTPKGSSLDINARVENPPHQSVHPSFNGLFPSNPVYDYHEGGMSYLGTIPDVGPDDSDSDDVSAKSGEKHGKRLKMAYAISI